MYQFIKEYPDDIENHISEEIQGVCHDDKHWFFTQDGSIWKIPVTVDLNQGFKSNGDKSIGVIKNHFGGHLGDMDYYDGHIFIADEPAEKYTFISVFNAEDLSLVVRIPMYFGKKRFHKIGWCAINKGYLYTSETMENIYSSPFYVYKIEKNSEGIYYLTELVMLIPTDENGAFISLKDMQGGCFDDQNRLHIANGFYENSGRDKQGISVFEVPSNPVKGNIYPMTRIAKSQQKGGFEYKFDSFGQEPEGITWWDMDLYAKENPKEEDRVPGIKGQLHVILLNNDAGKDNFWFKHYRRLPEYDKKPLPGRRPIRRPIKRASPNE